MGIRDAAALESALARPRSGYYSDLIQEAAALWESLSQNHAFVDGNKRVAVTMTAAFLRVNGYRLGFDDLEAFFVPDRSLRDWPNANRRTRSMASSTRRPRRSARLNVRRLIPAPIRPGTGTESRAASLGLDWSVHQAPMAPSVRIHR